MGLKASWIGYALCGAFLSQEDMDFFYHLVAITSRYTVFIREKELAFIAQQRELSAPSERPTHELIAPASPQGWR